MPDRDPYAARVDRALDHVARNLDGDLSLDALARVACFSPYHFHRIFRSATGETLNAHVRRVRLERAAQLMRQAPGRRLTDVALDVGFAGLSEFSRAFKAHFGVSASRWDRRAPLEKSKMRQAPGDLSDYPAADLERQAREGEIVAARVPLDGVTYAYVRTFDPYGNMRLVDVYHRILAWLADRGTDVADVVVVGMSLDDPSITPADRCRYDMGAAFPATGIAGIAGEIVRRRGGAPGRAAAPSRAECDAAGLSLRTLEPLPAVSVHCIGDLGLVERAWQYLYKVWLPASPYVPADAPAMELFERLPEEIGWERFDLHVCVPLAEP